VERRSSFVRGHGHCCHFRGAACSGAASAYILIQIRQEMRKGRDAVDLYRARAAIQSVVDGVGETPRPDATKRS